MAKSAHVRAVKLNAKQNGVAQIHPPHHHHDHRHHDQHNYLYPSLLPVPWVHRPGEDSSRRKYGAL